MTIPSVKVVKKDGNTGGVAPSAVGILALVCATATGTVNQPAQYTRDTNIVPDLGYGRLTSFASYALGVTSNPILAVKPTTSVAATYGAISQPGAAGTMVASVDGTVLPYDAWTPFIVFPAGGTIGTAGITYQYSLDGGVTLSAAMQLGTATSITIPNSGVKINLGAGTVIAGDTIEVGLCSPPLPNTTDLTASLAALQATSQPWEAVLIDATYTAAMGAQVDAWLTSLESIGKFKLAFLNTRMKMPGETEAAYATALVAVLGQQTSINFSLGADGADSVDWNQGVNTPRPTSLFAAARTLSQPIGTDPAEIDLGPLTNCSIVDSRNNPKYHNEEKYPGLDDLNLTTLTTEDGYSLGTYLGNVRLLSPANSDYVFIQHARCMNAACGTAWQAMKGKLSKGVRKSPTVGPNGARYIAESSASDIDGYVNDALAPVMANQVDSVYFELHRDDDISANTGAIVNADLELVALAYIKGVNISASFVKTITVSM